MGGLATGNSGGGGEESVPTFGRAPGAESGKVPFPAGFYEKQVELLERWYSTGRALPGRSKPRAWPRTPWEMAFGELVEVVQFKQLLK